MVKDVNIHKKFILFLTIPIICDGWYTSWLFNIAMENHHAINR